MFSYKSLIAITRLGTCLSLAILLSACSDSKDPVAPDEVTDGNVIDEPTADSNTVNNTELGMDDGTDTNTPMDTNSVANIEDFVFGSVSIHAYENESYISAYFMDFNQSIAQEIISTELQQPRSEDRCEAERDDGSMAYGEPLDLNLNPELVEYISAGEVLTVTGPNGTLTELQRFYDDIDDSIFYEHPANALYGSALPNDLSITIPGDEYPGFSDISIPNVQPLQLTANEIRDIFSKDSTLTWIASDDPQSSIYLSTYFTDLYITCNLVDDGEFTLPEGLKALISDEQLSVVDISRETVNFVRQGNTVLFIVTFPY